VYQNFVNFAMSGLGRQTFGTELGVEYNVGGGLSVNAAAAIGRYYYTRNTTAIITADNFDQVIGARQVYLQNFRLPSPQEAYTVGFTYRSPKYWFFSMNGNYFSQNHLAINPIRRTWEALKNTPPGTADYNAIFNQRRFDPQFTLDAFFGWSKRLPRSYNLNGKPTTFVFNLGLSNITNNRNILTGGFEQLRFDSDLGADGRVGVNKFPPRLFYAYGINFFASVGLRF